MENEYSYSDWKKGNVSNVFFQFFKSFDTIGISHLLKKTEYTAVDGISN